MGLFDSILAAAMGRPGSSPGANPLVGVLNGLLTQCGGLQGLSSRFSQAGHGGTFASWIGMGDNQAISADQIQKVLGSEQIAALAAKLGVDPVQATHFLAEYLPKIVDKLTPAGAVDPVANHHDGLAAMLPALLQSLKGNQPV